MIIVLNIKAVDKPIIPIHKDKTVCPIIKMIPEQFGEEFVLGFPNSGNQNKDTIPEIEVCEKMNLL
jgi:hypothetical protein